MIKRTRKIAGSCDDGPCPAIHETTHPEGLLAVQGYTLSPAELAAMGLPAGETVVLVDPATLDGWTSRQ
jgi:hypothetical protein